MNSHVGPEMEVRKTISKHGDTDVKKSFFIFVYILFLRFKITLLLNEATLEMKLNKTPV